MTLAPIPGHFLILAYTHTRSLPFSLTQDFALANGVSLEQAAIKVRSKHSCIHSKEYHPLSIIPRARCLAASLAFSLFLSPLPSLSEFFIFFFYRTHRPFQRQKMTKLKPVTAETKAGHSTH